MNKVCAGLIAGIAVACGTAHAQQAYPNRTIRMVIFLPAGGAGDFVTRVMAQKLGEAFKQTVVVENRPGAGGVVGSSFVAKAPPDGYTLLQGGITTHGIGPHLYKDLPYDPVKDFTPVILSGTAPVFLLVNAQLPVKSVAELVALAKAKPDSVSWASPGTGSAPHLVGELFKIVSGIPSPHVPYKGSATAAPDVAAGHVQFMFDAVAGHIPFLQSGRTRAFAMTNLTRLAAFPDVPTMAEAGYPKVQGMVWYGLLAPAGTPPQIVATLNTELRRILALPEVKEKLNTAGMDPAGGSSEDFGRFIRSELEKWGQVVRAAGIKVE